MKIIGKTKDSVLCSVSESEIARLLGYYGKYNREVTDFIDNGGEINLDALLGQMHKIAYFSKQISDAKNSFGDILETLDELSKISEPINGVGNKLI